MGDKKSKNKSIFSLIAFIELVIVLNYMIQLKVHPKVFYYAFKTLLIGTMNYGQAQLGTLVLTSSLIGLSLIIATSIILLESKKKFNITGSLKWLWMVPAISFIYAIFFSITKLLIGYNEVKSYAGSVGHISFVFLIIGLASFIFWFITLTLKLNSMSANNE